MAYTFDKQKLNRKNNPSSMSRGSSQTTQLPNSLVMRIMEKPQAEQEADWLSQGVASTTPDEIMREMGSRLGADFSNVQFHSDSLSMNRSQALGARAWAQGRDVYFNKEGFDPKVAAHELVHTVQQGAVQGNVSQSMPLGAVQMLPGDEDEGLINEDAVQDAKNAGADPLEAQILATFNSDFGSRCYRNFEKKLKEMVKKGGGKNIPTYTREGAIHFLVEGAIRDSSGKDILQEIVNRPIETKDDADQRAKEYRGFIKFLSTRLGDFGLEELAVETNLTDPRKRMKFDHTRSTKDTRRQRAYEIESSTKIKEGREGYDVKKAFNPTNDPELALVQDRIDAARSAKDAYRVFAEFTGNKSGSYKDSYNSTRGLDLTLLQKKLKNMARVVVDYPELRGKIGDMITEPKRKKDEKTKKWGDNSTIMATAGTLGGRHKAYITYNAFMDKAGKDMDEQRKSAEFEDSWKNLLTAPRAYAGTHELGHVLTSTLEDPDNEDQAIIQHKSNSISNDLLKKASGWNAWQKNIMSYDDVTKVAYHEHTFGNGQEIKTIDPRGSNWHKGLKHTSYYGSENPSEMFAEAVADVYAHGKEARPMSIELMKVYEQRQKEETKKRFFDEQRKPGFFKKYFGWLTKWF